MMLSSVLAFALTEAACAGIEDRRVVLQAVPLGSLQDLHLTTQSRDLLSAGRSTVHRIAAAKSKEYPSVGILLEHKELQGFM